MSIKSNRSRGTSNTSTMEHRFRFEYHCNANRTRICRCDGRKSVTDYTCEASSVGSRRCSTPGSMAPQPPTAAAAMALWLPPQKLPRPT